MPHFVLTEHAIDRYLERYDSTLTREEVVRALRDNSPRAVRLRRKTRSGLERWVLDEPRMVLLANRQDPKRPNDLIVVTILPDVDEDESAIPNELLEEAITTHLLREDISSAIKTKAASKDSQPKVTEAMMRHYENLREVLRLSIQRDRLCVEKHLNVVNRNLEASRRALRILLLGLRDRPEDPHLAALVKEASEIAPWIRSQKFLFGPGRDISQDASFTLDMV
jgi:hypothetical protein